VKAGCSQDLQPVVSQRFTVAARNVDGHVEREPTGAQLARAARKAA
jgi:hypothetical protein